MAIVEEQFASGGRDAGFASRPSVEGHGAACALTFALAEGFAAGESKAVCARGGWVHPSTRRQGWRRTEKT